MVRPNEDEFETPAEQSAAMHGDILIYGANGYTAQLIVERAVALGARPILAGRTEARLRPLAARFGLPLRVFAPGDAALVAKHLAGVRVVLNCAGPFTRTASVVAEGCIRAGAHYLDITGEIDVFEAIAAMGDRAGAAGVMLMPGVGFDVVPSDCLAAHLKRRLPDATRLTLAFTTSGRPSHGTATTMVENLHRGARIRRGGRIVAAPARAALRAVDFGHGPVPVMPVAWGDVSTAYRSTGIPDIAVYMAAPWPVRVASRLAGLVPAVTGSAPLQNLLKRALDARPGGPDAAARERGTSSLWGEAINAAGATARARIDTLEGYALTAITAWDIARRVAHAGAARPGYRTPAMVFGPDYVLSVPGTARSDL